MGYPVLALLTGPARGYVKNELKANQIPFFHTYPSNHEDLKKLVLSNIETSLKKRL